MQQGKTKAILYAFLAALLYLGAGIGIGILSLVNKKDSVRSQGLSWSWRIH